jgi:genome maintenance exonuclease 1
MEKDTMSTQLKKNNKYNYVRGSRSTGHGTRTYQVDGFNLPSVTTILSRTKDQKYLTKWREKVGHEEAERIFNLSSRRGTAMHKFLEKHIAGSGYEDLTDIGIQAKPMAKKIIEMGLALVSKYYGSEVTLYYPGLYAGTTDLVCRHNDLDTIIDFKQANRPKEEEWIEDYYLQIAAYAMAHDYVHKSNIQQGIIMVCTPDLYYQEFKFSGTVLRDWKHKFLKRLDEYYEIIKEPTVNEKELLKEFEENKIEK